MKIMNRLALERVLKLRKWLFDSKEKLFKYSKYIKHLN